MEILGKNNIDGILLEGGAALNWSALEAGIVDSVQTYLAPKVFGGTGMSAVAGEGAALPVDAIQLSNTRIAQYGEDYLIESDVVNTCLQEL